MSRRVGTKEGLLKRSRLGESAGGKLWERKRWEEPTTRLKTDPGDNPGRDLVREKRVKLVPQLVDELKVNTPSEERWVRSRRREGERRRVEEKEEVIGAEEKEGEGLSLNSVMAGMKRLRPVRRRLLAPGRRAGVRLGGGEETGEEDGKRGLGLGRRGGTGEKVKGVSEKSKERRRPLGESSEERRRWRAESEGRGGEVEGRGGSMQVQLGRGRQTTFLGRAKKGELLGGAGSLLKAHQTPFKRRPVTAR